MRDKLSKATVKLTLMYMSILTVICVFFSINWYLIATGELSRTLERQQGVLTTRPRLYAPKDVISEILYEATQRNIEAQNVIRNRIIATNIIIITSGTLGAYFLARRTLKPIEAAHERQARFTADASHELRTPLTAMKTEIEVTLRDKKLTKADAIEQLNSTLEELQTMSRLTEGLLRLSRQDSLDSYEKANVSLDGIVRKALDRVETQAAQKNITLSSEVSDVQVRAHFDSIVELLVILLDNAIKYSPARTTVRIACDVGRSTVTLHVIDNGSGILPTDYKKIFERFYQADLSRSSQTNEGHGLGLSIARSISDIHGANIRVHSSTHGAGSDFAFDLEVASD